MQTVSMIIPVFNRLDFLSRALVCLQHQSFLINELVVTDDGSSQDVLGLIREKAKELPFHLKYIRQQNKGFRLSKIRNNGVRASTGDWLIFLDQDIIYTNGFIRTFVDHFQPRRFLVAWEIRLSAAQTNQLTPDMLRRGDYRSLITWRQAYDIGRQYRKDLFYVFCKKLHVRPIGPKLRGGLFAVSRADFFAVNGFDENYQGWGNEDDDFGRRLDAAGITGRNPFLKEYPLHMWHEPYREGTKRVNLDYYSERVKQILQGDFYCQYGIDNPLDHEPVRCLEIK
ncbi:glycosyltransferase [candidate division KSB1 bacterium]|nr:glycosyltransferase [candidate division KSB1 bacterium]RQW07609.1 MAG: glycosyltransferase [candidate division KSB1 bacterium]